MYKFLQELIVHMHLFLYDVESCWNIQKVFNIVLILGVLLVQIFIFIFKLYFFGGGGGGCSAKNMD